VKHTLAVALALSGSLVLAAPARAADGDWAVGKGGMSRTIENVTVDYRLRPGDTDQLVIVVKGCGDEPWGMSEDLSTGLVDPVREAMAEEFANARLNCTLSEGLEARFLAGFDAAFAVARPTLPPRVETVAGWTLSDKGSHPGDDSDREVRLTRALSDVEVIYLPSGTGAGLTVNFRPCKGLNYNTGFGFEEGQDRSRQVSDQIAEGYADFTKDCKAALTPRADLMQGFPEAFATLDQWLKERPFTYPAEPATDDNKQGQ